MLGASMRQNPVPRASSTVRQEAYPVTLLDFEVLAMRLRDIGRGEAAEIVAVKENGHDLLL